MSNRLRYVTKVAHFAAAILLLVSVAGSLGCSEDGNGGGTGGADAGIEPDGPSDGDAGIDNDDTPRFATARSSVRLVERGSGAGDEFEGSVSVVLYAEAPPMPHEEVASEGACRLLTWEPAFCDPFCRDGLCIRENECVPWPPHPPAGRVTIRGIVRDLGLDPEPEGHYYNDEPLPGSLFEAGATVTVEAEGDEYPAFDLQAVGVAPLVHDFVSFEELPDGELEVTWQVSSTPGARVQARFITDYGHGTPPVVVECESADDGSLVVPASMVAELADSSNWSCGDCFPSTIRRYSRDSTIVDGHEVELIVSHDTWVYLRPF